MVSSKSLTRDARDAGPKPHTKPRGFLGFAEKNPRGPYIVGQVKVQMYVRDVRVQFNSCPVAIM